MAALMAYNPLASLSKHPLEKLDLARLLRYIEANKLLQYIVGQ